MGTQLRADILTSSSSSSRGLQDVPISAFGQKPSSWLPFRTKSLALGIVKLLVGISKESILSTDILNHTSFQRTSLTNVPENRLTPKRHNCTVLGFFAQIDFIAGFVGISYCSSPFHCPSSVKPYLSRWSRWSRVPHTQYLTTTTSQLPTLLSALTHSQVVLELRTLTQQVACSH